MSPLGGQPGEDREAPHQESWNIEKFIAAYNTVADEYGGWHYEENSNTPSLQERYEQGAERYPTIEAFAKSMFFYEQRE